MSLFSFWDRGFSPWGKQGFFSAQRQIFIHIWEAAPLPRASMQMSALADMIQAALMLNYNGRTVG